MQFREDINMLRAIAVIAVVLFHFYPELLPGGFIGVDIFFVISGFLMTSIIMEAIKQQKFSIIDFYLNRAYRIIPALAVLCLVLLALGWFWLTTVDYMLLGKHVASSISFISNFIYRLEAGYFDTTSKEKWLLHTWSLSIEWQFYIIYPIVLSFLAKRYSLKTIKNIVLLGGG
jgi:peptidoglycan/LPS O-acetylase OafA/YrhL